MMGILGWSLRNRRSCSRPKAEKFAHLVVDIQALYEVAQILDSRLRVTVVGHTDWAGAETVNRCLSQRRAGHVRALLSEHGAPSTVVVGGWCREVKAG